VVYNQSRLMSVDELLTQQQPQLSSGVVVGDMKSVRVEYGDYSSFKSTAKKLSLMDECKVGHQHALTYSVSA